MWQVGHDRKSCGTGVFGKSPEDQRSLGQDMEGGREGDTESLHLGREVSTGHIKARLAAFTKKPLGHWSQVGKKMGMTQGCQSTKAASYRQ